MTVTVHQKDENFIVSYFASPPRMRTADIHHGKPVRTIYNVNLDAEIAEFRCFKVETFSVPSPI